MTNFIVPFSQELANSLYNSTDQFPVDFDAAWQWLGYSRKSNAKVNFLSCGFVELVDYRVLQVKQSAPKGGLTHREDITLTVDCFKTWGMMANTPQGKQIRLYFLECERIAKAKQAPQLPCNVYVKRLLHVKDHKVPFGHWSVFAEASEVLIHVEQVLKFPIEDFDLLDGSIGTHWGAYRKGKFWAVAFKYYTHKYRDKRRDQEAKAYDDSELKYFRQWLDEIYVPNHLPDYLERKRKQQIKDQKKLNG